MRHVPARLSAYYVAHFTCTGIHLPFWALWLASRDVPADGIGVLIGLGYWVSIASSPLAGRISDRVGAARPPMAVLAVIATLGFVAFSFAWGVPALAVLGVITFGAHAALLPLAESITQAHAAAGNARYGRVRLWGSLAFIVASAGAGWLVEGVGVEVVPWLMAGGTLACLVASQQMPKRADARVPVASDEGEPAKPRAVAWGALVAGMVLAGAIQATHAVYYGFGSLRWSALGLDETTIGALWAEGVVAEIVLFALAPPIVARVGPAPMWIAGALAAALRWVLLAHASDVAWIAVAQLLHALSFGATHLGAMDFVRRALPITKLGTGQGMYTAILGLVYGLATPAAGALYERMHGDAYLVAAVVAGIGAVVAIAAGPAIVRAASAREG
ncbi:MFS transporter [Sandaracinus amylolyticus]|uniref:MFS transporter n=1 Tax=Sandaracinus amylolyticus TaxID=927083 RepID=UPI001F3729C3|nr:MFS transporter [Sandaracinus amylolyticus]UJR80241.1 MFS transporter permease [Sandaracinus amylolyticus]